MSPLDPGETGDLGHEIVRLGSADNFRDVTGPGYRAADGVALRPGVLYRSNELQLSHADAATLAGLGVSDVLDLREAAEVEAHPDAAVPGATWRHLPVEGVPLGDVADLPSREAAVEVMGRVYRELVEAPGARGAYADLLRTLAGGRAPQLFHCTAGKDRTGWAAALLLRLCGVAEETVRADYLRSNHVDGTRTKYLGLVREHLGEEKVEVYEAVMVVDLAYLAQADAAVARCFGGLEGYLREGLGLDDEVLAALRNRLRAA